MVITLDDFVEEDDDEGKIRWDMETMTLTGNMRSKVRRFVRDGLVERAGKGKWYVHPIPGHTHLTHTVERGDDGGLTCTCQRWRTKGLTCTHIYAVLVFEGKMEM